MKCVILHSEVALDAPPEELDVLEQAASVKAVLSLYGYAVETLGFSLNTQEVSEALLRCRPDFVFNLTENIGGSMRHTHLAPALLDALKIPYTGCSTRALFVTTDKLLTKRIGAACGLATPAWIDGANGLSSFEAGVPYICKTVYEEGSAGLTDECVQSFETLSEVHALLKAKEKPLEPWFAEKYIEGREFNLSLCQTGNGRVANGRVASGSPTVQVLPPAEIVFQGYPHGKPRIVGYEAKWRDGSFEDCHTARRFEFAPEDGPLLDELRRLALKCWDVFELSGYARVDFRVDEAGKLWILEVNANPCIAPDAGFAKAAERAGLSYAEIIMQIASSLVKTQ